MASEHNKTVILLVRKGSVCCTYFRQKWCQFICKKDKNGAEREIIYLTNKIICGKTIYSYEMMTAKML